MISVVIFERPANYKREFISRPCASYKSVGSLSFLACRMYFRILEH